MSVDGWAQEQGAYMTGYDSPEREPFAQGIVHAFSVLLSDEAVEAAALAIGDDCCEEHFRVDRGTARAALQAAVDAVTNPELHDSGSTEENNDD